jgi:hypothetical protein
LEVMKRGLPKYFLELINSFEWIRNYIPRQWSDTAKNLSFRGVLGASFRWFSENSASTKDTDYLVEHLFRVPCPIWQNSYVLLQFPTSCTFDLNFWRCLLKRKEKKSAWNRISVLCA